MLGFAKSVLSTYTQHPLLVSLVIVGALFATGGIIVEESIGNGTAAAFLIVYGIIAVSLSLTGYLLSGLSKLVIKIRRRTGFSN
jgi:hypothetical protein